MKPNLGLLLQQQGGPVRLAHPLLLAIVELILHCMPQHRLPDSATEPWSDGTTEQCHGTSAI
jgi:hypothetical protein